MGWSSPGHPLSFSASNPSLVAVPELFGSRNRERRTREIPPSANEVSLDDELFLTKQYLEIERLRYGDRLRVEITVDPVLLSCLVPHLFLQPLVENSIRLGIAPRLGSGLVSIVARKDRDQLIIKVCDDGLGKQSRPGSKNGDSKGIGLKNIDRRLTELYGDQCGLQLQWPQTGGWEAILKIPWHEDPLVDANHR